MKNNRLTAKNVYLIMTSANWLIFSLFSTVVNVYLATEVTNDPFQLVIIWTVYRTTTLLFEIPTGIVADVYSRRLSVIIGHVLIGMGAIIEGVFPVFEVILLAQIVWGIGFTFISGADDAWIADEIGEERVGRVFMRSSQIGQIAFLIGIPISTALGTIALRIPIILAGILFILLAIFLILVMPEEGFIPRRQDERESWRTMFITVRESIQLLHGRSVLLAILLISAVYGLSSAGFDNLWTVNILENLSLPSYGNFKPVVWFGIINTIVTILGIAGTEIAQRRVDTNNQAAIVRALMFLTGATAVCMMAFGLARSFWIAAIVYSLSITLRVISDPILRTWINQNAETSVRATVLSIDSQVNSLGQMIGGSAIGAIGSAVSLQVALLITGLARVPVTMLFARLVVQERRT